MRTLWQTIPLIIVIGTYWIALRHERNMLLPYALSLLLLPAGLALLGIHPLGFLVSVGGWLWLTAMAWVAVPMAYAIRYILRRA